MMPHPPNILIVDDHREIRDAMVKYRNSQAPSPITGCSGAAVRAGR